MPRRWPAFLNSPDPLLRFAQVVHNCGQREAIGSIFEQGLDDRGVRQAPRGRLAAERLGLEAGHADVMVAQDAVDVEGG